MSRSVDQEFYQSKAWRRCREAYMTKVNHLCERCRAEGVFEPARIVHHKIYLTKENVKDPSVSLNFDNLEALCERHHNQEHFKQERRYEIAADGSLIMLDIPPYKQK